MDTNTAYGQVLARLLVQYGPLLTTIELAAELRTSKSSIYNRRARGNAAGLPAPVPGTVPQLYRASELAFWLIGQYVTSPVEPLQRRKGKAGRPRKVATPIADAIT